MASFAIPYVPTNADSWGPPSKSKSSKEEAIALGAPINKFEDLPYAPFGRADRIGRAADFTAQANWGGRGGNYKDRRRFGEDQGKNEGFQYRVSRIGCNLSSLSL